MYNGRMRNLEMPENLFSNLGVGNFSSRVNNVQTYNNDKEFYSQNVKEDVKLVNYSQKNEYRDRINKMYNEINIKPIDDEVSDSLYFNNYVEKGIVVKPKVSALKQFWTEYRLIDNEKNLVVEKKDSENLANFDDLFDALSIRMSEINGYIDELKEMRINIDKTNKKLEADIEQLANERSQFDTYKQKEETKLNAEKENLKLIKLEEPLDVDDDKIHIEEHTKFIISNNNSDSKFISALTKHIQKHKEKLYKDR